VERYRRVGQCMDGIIVGDAFFLKTIILVISSLVTSTFSEVCLPLNIDFDLAKLNLCYLLFAIRLQWNWDQPSEKEMTLSLPMMLLCSSRNLSGRKTSGSFQMDESIWAACRFGNTWQESNVKVSFIWISTVNAAEDRLLSSVIQNSFHVLRPLLLP